MLQDIGLFDTRLRSYYEDVDLSFRARLRGYRCRYVPDPPVDYTPTESPRPPDVHDVFLLQRNKLYVILKHVPLRVMWSRRRDVLGSYLEAMRRLRVTGVAGLPSRLHISLLKRLPWILAARFAGLARRKPGTAARIARGAR